MNAESATDNVWADAGHTSPDDNTAPTLSPQQFPVEPLTSSVELTSWTKNVADDDQLAPKKWNLGRKINERRKTIAVKAWRARYALLVVFSYVCWLILTFLMVHSAATGVRGVLMPSYRTTTYRLSNIHSEQSLLLSKFEDLQGIHLQKRPFETHLKCLTRVINIAQEHYGDLPYQSYPLVDEHTTQWAQSECDRIILSPVLIPRSGWDHFWRALTDHAGAAFFRCKGVVDSVMKAKKQRSQKSSHNAQNVALSLPSGYHLDCNDAKSLCHLLSVPLHRVSRPGIISSEEMKLINKGRRILQIIDGCKFVSKLAAIVKWLIPWMNQMAIAFQIITYEVLKLIDGIPYQPRLHVKIMGCSVIFFACEAVLMCMYFWHQRFTSKDNFSRTITTTTYAVHFVAVLLCCAELVAIWWARTMSFRRFLWAFRELRAAYSESSEETIRKIQMEYNAVSTPNEDGNATSNPGGESIDKQTVVVEGDGADHISRLPDLHISPGSSFDEDVKLMREHLHRKKALPKLASQALRPQGSRVADSSDSVFTISPTSDSGWSILTSPEDEAIMISKMDN